MHNQISPATEQETHTSPDNSNSTWGNETAWVTDMHSFQNHQQTSMSEYNGSNYSFMPSMQGHGLPSESLGRMPPPPQPHAMAQGQTTLAQLPPQLPMLAIPSHPTWPSMLTNPSYNSHSAPPTMSIPPIQVTPRVQATLKTKLPALHTQPPPRKTLTDDDRKRMCQYAEEHPHAKQTDIGARFGVERSTVSKVLRNKEKYLYPETKTDTASSPLKRKSKGGVDVERALSNYVKNAQKSGQTITDAHIKEKARLFATMGKSDDAVIKANSAIWLDKFKQKYGLGGQGRLMRRASETNIPDSIRGSPSLSASQPSSAISPNSPAGHLSPSPLSADPGEDGRENKGTYFATVDYSAETGGYRHSNSQSTTSLSSVFTDAGGSSFSGSALSPLQTPFTFSPDSNVGGFLDHSRQQLPGGAASNYQRPRSQTFPSLDLEYMDQQQNTEPLTPRYHVSSTAPSSALESPANEIPQPTYGTMDQQATMSPPHHLRHSSSANSLTGRSTAASAAASSPNSPTQEDARRAADLLLTFISHVGGFADQGEYMTVVRLTEKLRISMGKNMGQQQQGMGMGGLDRIPEQDSEMANASPERLGIKAAE